MNLGVLLRNPLVLALGALLLLEKDKPKRRKKRKSTRKGQTRKTARRAYEPKRRKRRTVRKTTTTKRTTRKTRGKRKVSKAQFSKMVRANKRFSNATKARIIRNYRG